MALFMVQATYTPEAWAKMTRNPENREQALRSLCERAGARLQSLYFSFGETDVVALFDAPDAKTAAAIAVAANSAGHLKACKTTELLSTADSMDVMKKAGGLSYQAPKG